MKKRWEVLGKNVLFYGVTILMVLFIALTIASWGLANLTQEENLKQVLPGETTFDEFYFQDFDCTLLHCLVQGKGEVLLSQQGHNFMERTKYFLLLGTAVLVVLFALHAHSGPSLLIHGGTILALLGIPAFFLSILPTMLSFMQNLIDIQKVMDFFLAPILPAMWVLFGLGVVSIISGISWRFIAVGKGSKKT